MQNNDCYPGRDFRVQGRGPDEESGTIRDVVGGSNMKTVAEAIVLILGIVMVAPLPYEVIIGGYGRLAMAILGFLLVFWWLFRNDHNSDLRDASAK
jgi:hypothetical protein